MSPPRPRARAYALCVASALAVTLAASPSWGAGGGGGPSGGSSGSPGAGARGKQQIAAKKYERALEYIAKAHAYEERLSNASTEEQPRLEKKARKYYGKALDKLDSALRRDPVRHEAHSDRGYVLRKLGDFEDALDAYDEALSLAPRYAPAIEYRAEAYLELGRLDDAKKAHTRLMRVDRELADQLLEKMQAFVARADGSAGSDASDLSAFGEWVASRSTAIRHSASGSEAGRW